MSLNTAKSILEYWHKLECFTPFDPKNEKSIVITELTKNMPWSKLDEKYTFNIYIGTVSSEMLLEKLKTALNIPDKSHDKDYSKTCIFCFKLSYDGKYIENSFSTAHFVWAISQVVKNKSFKADLTDETLKSFNEEIDKVFAGFADELSFNDFIKTFEMVNSKLDLGFTDKNFYIVCNPDFKNEKEGKNSKAENFTNITKDNSLDEVDVSTEMFPSFYKQDLSDIQNLLKDNDSILKYILSPIRRATKQIEIDKDISQMMKWLNPVLYPLGKWPSKFNPSLMQQIAINIAISKKEYVFSVNGPPGTGKTTLLKEVIASNVVQRAVKLIEYDIPDNAFSLKKFEHPKDKFSETFYTFKDKTLNDFSIMVASNNNAAVENISKELPIAFDTGKTLTGLFESDEDIYFTDTAELLNEGSKSWGIISARFGKKSNIKEFINAVIENKKVGLKSKISAKKDFNYDKWQLTRINFRNKLDEVLDYQKKFSIIAEEKYKIIKLKNKNINIAQKIKSIKEDIVSVDFEINKSLIQQKGIQSSIKTVTDEIQNLSAKVGFFKKIIAIFFDTNSNTQLNDCKKHLASIQKDLELFHNQNKNLQITKNELLVELNYWIDLENDMKVFDNTYKNLFGSNYMPDNFFDDILNNRESHKSCPWVNSKYDSLREELFFLALQVHKEFILVSNSVKQNLDRFNRMTNGEYNYSDKDMGYTSLLNTVQLVVPVISTTFASVSTFLKHVGKEELGTLVIDEAGQATPFSAVGALWRSKTAIIVGDPLQVKPVIVTAEELADIFIEKLNLNKQYRSFDLSVQIFADNINPYGSNRDIGGMPLWLGCPLVVHRRCISPMFDISNAVAYDDKMFNETFFNADTTKLSIIKSSWLHVSGAEKGMKNHYVRNQGAKAIEIVIEAFNKCGLYPSIYVISPFKTVINDFKKELSNKLMCTFDLNKDELKEYISKSCGTVHTFQGKEANEVIFLLGCDQESGSGAANWVGTGPNILNVAVSRAKYRIVIIGDKYLWNKVKFFDIALDCLNIEDFE